MIPQVNARLQKLPLVALVLYVVISSRGNCQLVKPIRELNNENLTATSGRSKPEATWSLYPGQSFEEEGKLLKDQEKTSHHTSAMIEIDSDSDTFASYLKNAPDMYFNFMDQVSMRIEQFGLLALETRFRSLFYGDCYIHKYDTHEELKSSSGPEVDQELCLRHLENLYERSKILRAKGLKSLDINLYLLFDTFGRVPSGLLSGDAFWTGHYRGCTRLSIKIDDESPKVKTRYCTATLRHKDWDLDQPHSLRFLKTGVCLPATCDSFNYKNKFELVRQLFQYQLRDVDRGAFEITDLYCLPDEQSPLRTWYWQPVTLGLVCLLGAWIVLLIYSTYKYELLNHQMKQRIPEEINPQQSFGLTGGSKLKQDEKVVADSGFKLYEILALTVNLKKLFDTSSASSLTKMTEMSKEGTSTRTTRPTTTSGHEDKIVDLSVIEGIKVISMLYIITGHVLMCVTQIMTNGRELAYTSSPAYVLANLMPAFAVNSFFVITGLLFCYLLMKQNQTQSFMNSPSRWFALFIYRYLRIMPMYALVVAYLKYIAKFTGSGPMWDYGTSSLSQRKVCEQESWWWVIGFVANFKSPMDHCIPSAWYLANDFQFFLVSPIFLIALHKSPSFGQWLLRLCIALGYIIGIVGIMSSPEEDFRPVVKFEPHGFKHYVTHLSYSYTQPHHRISAYLVGLLIGYSLYRFEQESLLKVALVKEQAKRGQEDLNNNNNNNTNDNVDGHLLSEESVDACEKVRQQKQPMLEKHDWSPAFKYWAPSFSGLFMLVGILTPSVASRLPFNVASSKIAVALYLPTYHLLFSTAVGLYILLATTGNGNRLLNSILMANFWKPLARLSLCVVLINIEVVVYNIQSFWQAQYISSSILVSLNLTYIILSYLVAILICVLFEAPMRGCLNHLLSLAINRMAAGKQKTM